LIIDDREIGIKYDKENSLSLEVQALLLAPEMSIKKSILLANKINTINTN